MNLQKFAYGLLECLQEYGEHSSNPVLTLLAGMKPLNEQKYPAQAISFGDGGWRLFYHCHDAPGRSEAEHGHFHIYVMITDQQTGKPAWAHVAGLAMDRQGQPLHWFAVNRWVTDGPWFEHTQLTALLEDLSERQEEECLTRWITNLLCLYRDELLHLLKERDQQIDLYCQGRSREAIFTERKIYKLVDSNINMLEKLMSAISQQDRVVAQ